MLRSLGSVALALTLGAASACGSAEGGTGESDSGTSDSDDGGDGDGDPGDPCTPGDAPTLVIGTGEVAYAPLADGETIELVRGPQGGVHTLIALHAEDIDASEEVLGKLEGYLDGEPLASSSPYLNMRCNSAAGGLQVWNLFLVWDAAPEALHQQPIVIEAEVVDLDGVKVTASKEAIIHDPLLD